MNAEDSLSPIAVEKLPGVTFKNVRCPAFFSADKRRLTQEELTARGDFWNRLESIPEFVPIERRVAALEDRNSVLEARVEIAEERNVSLRKEFEGVPLLILDSDTHLSSEQEEKIKRGRLSL